MLSTQRESFFYAETNNFLQKVQYPCLFYVEKKVGDNIQKFYLLGTCHSLSLNIFSNEVRDILLNQSQLLTEHMSIIDAINANFEFFQTDKNFGDWWHCLQDEIKLKLTKAFPGLNEEQYSQIHPKYYFLKIIATMFRNGSMDNELESYYKAKNKTRSYLETYMDKEVIEDMSSFLNNWLHTLSNYFPLTTLPSCLFNFEINCANDWINLFNFLFKENNYQLYYDARNKEYLEIGIQSEYLTKEPIIDTTPFRSATDLRSKNWYDAFLITMNDSLIACGRNHLLKGPNCLLKKLSDNGYDIYLVDNMSNKSIYDVQSQYKMVNLC